MARLTLNRRKSLSKIAVAVGAVAVVQRSCVQLGVVEVDALRKILALHGGGGTGPTFCDELRGFGYCSGTVGGATSGVAATCRGSGTLSGWRIYCATAAYASGGGAVWISDPPGGGNEGGGGGDKRRLGGGSTSDANYDANSLT